MPQYPPLECKVTFMDPPLGRGVGNVVFEGARFYGKPNFSGVMNQWKDDSRQFTILIPVDAAERMIKDGWHAKIREARTPEEDTIAHVKVAVDFSFHSNHPGDVLHERGPDIWVISNGNKRKLNSRTAQQLDRARNIDNLDVEIRGWEYNREDHPGKYSARLVALVAVMRTSILEEKYPDEPVVEGNPPF